MPHYLEHVAQAPASDKKRKTRWDAPIKRRGMRAPDDYLHMNVRLADFGEAQQSLGHNLGLIQPNDLRAPEVILRTGWGPKADIWSLACVVSGCYPPTLIHLSIRSADYYLNFRSGSYSNIEEHSTVGFLQPTSTHLRVTCGRWFTTSDLHRKISWHGQNWAIITSILRV